MIPIQIKRHEVVPGYYWDFVTTDEDDPIGSVKALTNIHGVPWFEVNFDPLEFIGIMDKEVAIGLIVKLYETTLEYLANTEATVGEELF